MEGKRSNTIKSIGAFCTYAAPQGPNPKQVNVLNERGLAQFSPCATVGWLFSNLNQLCATCRWQSREQLGATQVHCWYCFCRRA